MRTFLSFKPLTGLHVLLILIVFFGTIITVNITMAVLANSTWSGLVAKNGYVASIDYTKASEGRKAAAALGWTVSVETVDGRVSVSVEDGSTEPVYLSGLDAEAVRSVTRDDLTPLEFTTTSAGTYRSEEVLPAGDWVVVANFRKGSDSVPWRAVLRVE